MSMRRRTVWVLAAAVVLVVSGCGSSADPDTWTEAEEDERFLDAEFELGGGRSLEFEAKSAVEHNFMQACLVANTTGDLSLDPVEALGLCRCSFDDLRRAFDDLQDFKSLDKALRENPNPSDLDDEPEDLWDDTAEDIFEACARRVDA